MCPRAGQLLLLPNYRLCNPVTHQGSGSCGNRRGFWGDGGSAKGKPQRSRLSSQTQETRGSLMCGDCHEKAQDTEFIKVHA